MSAQNTHTMTWAYLHVPAATIAACDRGIRDRRQEGDIETDRCLVLLALDEAAGPLDGAVGAPAVHRARWLQGRQSETKDLHGLEKYKQKWGHSTVRLYCR